MSLGSSLFISQKSEYFIWRVLTPHSLQPKQASLWLLTTTQSHFTVGNDSSRPKYLRTVISDRKKGLSRGWELE